ncbi:MAG: hypothetical protein IKW83_07145 [Muribaculaceae bacterium]|nr:hypothetical protein [Muribaculaceae bacterium]
METKLFQQLKNALPDGELDSAVKDSVVVELRRIMDGIDLRKNGIAEDDLHNVASSAVDYALNLFIVDWKNIVEESEDIDNFNCRLEVLCYSAIYMVGYRLRHDFGRTMGIVSFD